jgi:hypothetical protein
MNSLLQWYTKLHPTTKSFIRALSSFALFYAGIVAEHHIVLDLEKPTLGPLLLKSIALGLAGVVLFGFSSIISSKMEDAAETERKRQEQLAYASSLISQYVANQVQFVASATVDTNQTKDIFIPQLVSSRQRIQELTTRVHQFFEAKYGQSEKIDDKIDFEVTFMTKSYIDHGITIPAFANRMGRAPKSMLDRPGNPSRYDQSLTAEVYKDGLPEMRLVSDTSDPKARYVQLYAGQTERIKSTIVYPVLSYDNRILGTLVVHCNRKNFFSPDDAKFWREIFEGFTRRLALEKTRIDVLMSPVFEKVVGFTVPAPF